MDAADTQIAEGHYTRLLSQIRHHSELDDGSIIIDERDSRLIISKIVYPDLTKEWNYSLNTTFHNCPCLGIKNNRPQSKCFPMCTDHRVINSMCMRHESNLDWSIEFAGNRLETGNDCSQAMSLLCHLLAVARNRQQWGRINNWMTKLLNHPKSDIRAYANMIFLHLVRPDAENLERLSGHFEIMIKMFNDPSEEVRRENRGVWKIISQSNRIGPQGRKVLRTIIDLWLLELDGMVDKPVRDFSFLREFHQPEPALEALSNYAWLILPRLQLDSDEIDYHSASNQLYNDIMPLIDRGRNLLKRFGDIFQSIIEKNNRCYYEDNFRFPLIFNRFCWLALKNRLWTPYLLEIKFARYKKLIERKDYRNYWKFMMEMYDDHSIHENRRGHEMLECLHQVSYDIGMPEIVRSAIIKRSSLSSSSYDFFDHSHSMEWICDFSGSIHAFIDKLYKGSNLRRLRYIFGGIQTRRLVVILLCKGIISMCDEDLRDANTDFYLRLLIDSLEQLRAAYGARMAQECTADDREKLLLPTCLELALPIPFDDPESNAYICEFAFFRDTLDYIERKKSKESFRWLCSRLSDEDKNRLHYYRYEYNDFHICCSAMRSDGEQFQCIEHKFLKYDGDEGICPILNRRSIQDPYMDVRSFTTILWRRGLLS